MYGEILQAVKALALGPASPYTEIELGSMPPSDGLAMYLGPGASDGSYLNRSGTYNINIGLNGKHANQGTVVTALSNIHMSMSRLAAYPSGAQWHIFDIRTVSAPAYIEQEESSRQWLYGSILGIRFYVKGV